MTNSRKSAADKGLTWDVLIVDEAHEGVDTYKTDTAFNHIRRKWTLHLSGTPFKALANDKFPESAIYNWTYADEQKKKRDWDASCEIGKSVCQSAETVPFHLSDVRHCS